MAGLSKDRQLLVAMVGFFLSGSYYYGPFTCHGFLLMFLVLHPFVYLCTCVQCIYTIYISVCFAELITSECV